MPPKKSTAPAAAAPTGPAADKPAAAPKTPKKSAAPSAAVTDSVNQFADLPTAAPSDVAPAKKKGKKSTAPAGDDSATTTEPSSGEDDKKKKAKRKSERPAEEPEKTDKRKSTPGSESAKRMSVAAEPKAGVVPPMVPLQGLPSMGGRPGCSRIFFRHWIRNFAHGLPKFQTYPYKKGFGDFFFSFGYYPDMASPTTLARYTAYHPYKMHHHSIDSGQYGPDPNDPTGGEVMQGVEGAANKKKSQVPGNQRKSQAPGDQSKARTKSVSVINPSAAGTGDDEGGTGKKKKQSMSAMSAATGKTGKGKEGVVLEDAAAGAAGAAAVGAAAAGAVAAKGKANKSKASAPETSGTDASTTETDAECKGKKKKSVKPASALSGNISYDPNVYDLTTLTVMNLPTGANDKKLKIHFPGATISMENGGARVKFKDVASAEPFFAKDLALDGMALVVSPKLKS